MDCVQLLALACMCGVVWHHFIKQETHRHLDRGERILKVVRHDGHHLLARATRLLGGAKKQSTVHRDGHALRHLFRDCDVTMGVPAAGFASRREQKRT